MKTQVLLIHGGMTFKNRKDYIHYIKTRDVSTKKKVRWSDDYLDNELGKDFQVIKPRMPLVDNAKYEDWEIQFKRYIPLLKDRIVLVGVSLGGIFLAKYLSEHKFPKKIISVFLIGAPYDNSCKGEDLVGGFKLKFDLSLLEKNTKNLYLMFSKNYDVIPLSHARKYKNKLKKAKIIIYKNKNGHFKVSKFRELVRLIKADVKRN